MFTVSASEVVTFADVSTALMYKHFLPLASVFLSTVVFSPATTSVLAALIALNAL